MLLNVIFLGLYRIIIFQLKLKNIQHIQLKTHALYSLKVV